MGFFKTFIRKDILELKVYKEKIFLCEEQWEAYYRHGAHEGKGPEIAMNLLCFKTC